MDGRKDRNEFVGMVHACIATMLNICFHHTWGCLETLLGDIVSSLRDTNPLVFIKPVGTVCLVFVMSKACRPSEGMKPERRETQQQENEAIQ